jgi:hypothetical protein
MNNILRDLKRPPARWTFGIVLAAIKKAWADEVVTNASRT